MHLPYIEKYFKHEHWEKANYQLLTKMIEEYTYEDMLKPEIKKQHGKWDEYMLPISDNKQYTFLARKDLFGGLKVKAGTICEKEDGTERPADHAIQFLLDIQPIIGMSSETAGHLIKELNNTLVADMHLLGQASKTSDELIKEDYALLEGHMSGHPWITYNKGRIGFGYDDYCDYAPEMRKETKLYWIAVHKERASFQSTEKINYHKLLHDELSLDEKKQFEKVLQEWGVDEQKYFYLPVHEWQWKNVIIQQFAEELSRQMIIPLGKGEDNYLPQQSIRTFVNQSHKEKHHVKVPMSILNTLVYRGLPAERTLIAPKITEFIKGIYEKDDFLKETCRVILPGEVASINVDHSLYPELENSPYQYLEMLGVIWRESIYTYLDDGEKAITLAALLHEDNDGKPFVSSLIEASGMSPEEWLKEFFRVVMDPLLHYLYQYGTVFSPHGQNTILVMKDFRPHRLAVKDFVDDVNISDQPFEELSVLSQELKDVLRSEPPEGLTQFIFTGLFVCHLRYMADILDRQEAVTEYKFWECLADSIKQYQDNHLHLKDRFKLFDFFKPELTKLTLNRNRMVDYGYEDGDDRPHASESGKVTNPLARFAREVHFS
ncbi:IucA/IucC family protein [Thalassobacillus devorans]|uniref:IucA/IucC family protein n=1 Tax=Thalassobacillus devorans TaxID=279813 RepID=UPI00111BE4E6|nr:IucA/IucC family siderophore biosynthesis protein [Thalassobacillus devorans]